MMENYRVILADDEKYVRLWLKNCIDWAAEGFEIVGEATNAPEAIALAERLAPDLIVSDMEMPDGDGSMLLQKINQQYPDICLVVVSGYEKYEYIRSAVRNNAVDYLLKPLKPEMLKEVLERVKVRLELRRDEHAWMARIHSENETLRQSQVIASLLGGMPAEQGLLELAGAHAWWMVVLAECGQEMATCRQALAHSAEAAGMAFISAPGSGELICILGGGSASALTEFAAKAAEALPESMMLYAGLPKDNPRHIAPGYTEARIAAIEAEPHSALRFYQYQPPERSVDSISTAQEQQLLLALRTQDRPLAHRVTTDIFSKFMDSKLSARYAYTKIITILMRFGFEAGIRFEQLGLYEAALFARAGRMKTVAAFQAGCEEMLDAFFEMPGALNIGKRDVVAAAKGYIMAHYSRDVSLDEIAGHAGVSANYLCNVFKHETGESVFEFVSAIRIERAKELLKLNTKVYEVAEAVGYSDAKYFSRVFKKVTGQSPGEYRQKR